jgi:hypothetical protein
VTLRGEDLPVVGAHPCEPCKAEREQLQARVKELDIELQLRQAEHEAANAELRRRIINQAESMGFPRLQDVAEAHALRARITELELMGKGVIQGLHANQCTPAERAVLDAMAIALKRLGDDPPYYEVYEDEEHERPDFLDLNPALAGALNAWTTELARRLEPRP